MPGLHDMVRDALAETGLDPDVRALAVEALEAKLLARARVVLGDAVDPTVTLRDDGSVRLAWRDAKGAAELELPDGARANVDEPTRKALVAGVQRELITQLAPSLGAARVAVKNGATSTRAPVEAPTRPSALALVKPSRAEPSRADEVAEALRALAELATLQQGRLDALAKALRDAGIAAPDERPEHAARARELRAVVEALSKG